MCYVSENAEKPIRDEAQTCSRGEQIQKEKETTMIRLFFLPCFFVFIFIVFYSIKPFGITRKTYIYFLLQQLERGGKEGQGGTRREGKV